MSISATMQGNWTSLSWVHLVLHLQGFLPTEREFQSPWIEVFSKYDDWNVTITLCPMDLPLSAACFRTSLASKNWEFAIEHKQALYTTVSSSSAWSTRGGIPVGNKKRKKKYWNYNDWGMIIAWLNYKAILWKAPWIILKSLWNSKEQSWQWFWPWFTPPFCCWKNKTNMKWRVK